MKLRNTRDLVVVILTATASICVIALVGVSVYAVAANTIDWTDEHIKGPNITTPLATLIGSLLSAVIAGVVGYLTGRRGARWEEKTGTPPSDPITQMGSAVNDIVDRITGKN